jgi:hypothetical protein
MEAKLLGETLHLIFLTSRLVPNNVHIQERARYA